MGQTDLQRYITLAKLGTKESVNEIMKELNKSTTLAQTKFIDYALGLVKSCEGTDRLKHFLFYGTKMQRNYCALYFGRLDEYSLVRQAYEKGLVDAKQAFSR